jgi:tRNA-specific 2-thiouridylase
VDAEALEHHLSAPRGRGHVPAGARRGTAGGAACGDLVRVDVLVEGGHVTGAGFEASGCGAAQAAGSAVVTLAEGRSLLDAARISVADVSAELGGLSAGKVHAAELAADALHTALGEAARRDASLPPDPGRTLVAMSGGVDSAVAALRCRAEGRCVVAVTLELWRDPENDAESSCCSAHAARAARSLAHGLGLPHLTIDLRDEFRAGVVDPWLDGHRAGETPNPCVRCNGHVRLDAMLDLAAVLGCADLATGHYARIAHDADGALLRSGADPAKDQAYALAALAPASVARLRLPLGDLTKPEVRALAAEAGLPVAGKPDSQDLCFLAGTGRERFLARHGGLGDEPGDIVDEGGRVLGRHHGAHRFTVGQRRGLDIGGGRPLYVLRTDRRERRVVVGPREALAVSRVRVRGAVLHRDGERVGAVRLRYHATPVPCRIAGPAPAGRHGELWLELDEPVPAVAAGQAACLLDGDLVVGSGTIAPVPAPSARAAVAAPA